MKPEQIEAWFDRTESLPVELQIKLLMSRAYHYPDIVNHPRTGEWCVKHARALVQFYDERERERKSHQQVKRELEEALALAVYEYAGTVRTLEGNKVLALRDELDAHNGNAPKSVPS